MKVIILNCNKTIYDNEQLYVGTKISIFNYIQPVEVKSWWDIYTNVLFHWKYFCEKNTNDHKSSFWLFLEMYLEKI